MANSIGSLWVKESKKTGKKYMSGFVTIDGEKTQIVIFKNEKKEKENSPDYRILKSEPISQT